MSRSINNITSNPFSSFLRNINNKFINNLWNWFLNFTILKGKDISGGILYYQIMNGITGTGMPYFKRDLESQKIWEVGDYVAVYFINQSDANGEPRGIDASWEP